MPESVAILIKILLAYVLLLIIHYMDKRRYSIVEAEVLYYCAHLGSNKKGTAKIKFELNGSEYTTEMHRMSYIGEKFKLAVLTNDPYAVSEDKKYRYWNMYLRVFGCIMVTPFIMEILLFSKRGTFGFADDGYVVTAIKIAWLIVALVVGTIVLIRRIKNNKLCDVIVTASVVDSALVHGDSLAWKDDCVCLLEYYIDGTRHIRIWDEQLPIGDTVRLTLDPNHPTRLLQPTMGLKISIAIIAIGLCYYIGTFYGLIPF